MLEVGSPQIHPLYLPEILQATVEFSGVNVSYALVCKTWASVALPLKWKSIPFRAVQCLFARDSLSQLGEGERISETVFASTSQAIKGLHERYLSMVQMVDMTTTDLDDNHDFILEVASFIESRELFPNLKRLDVAIDSKSSSQLQSLRILTHATLKQLCIKFTQTPSADVFLLIRDRMPHLENIQCNSPTITSNSALSSLEGAFVAMVHNLSKLKTVIIPTSWFTRLTISALMACPQLEHIGVCCFQITPTAILPSIPSTMFPGSFPCLSTLQLLSPFRCLASFFSSGYRLPKLKTVHFTTLNESTESMGHLMEVLYSGYPCLESLFLLVFQSDIGSMDDWASLMKYTQGFTQLRNLTIFHTCTLNLTHDDIASLGHALPRLESLRPAPSWGANLPPRLGITELLLFPSLFPALKHLQLHLNVSAPTFPIVPSGNKFSRLETLEVGAHQSEAKNAGALVLFLEALLPNSCSIVPVHPIPGGWSEVITLVRASRAP